MKATEINAALQWKSETSPRRTTVLLLLITVWMKCADSTADELYRAPENGSQSCRRITAALEIQNSILNNLNRATPCACFERQMALDYSFQKIGTCYKQWFSEKGLKQMCCYNAQGNLLLGPKNGGYIIPDILESDIADIHDACCEDVYLCKLFYQTFPSNNCSGHTDVLHATTWGDPEITTVDKHTYSFNGRGEYTFLETSNKSLQIQTRTDFLIKGNKDATLFVAFVLADNLSKDTCTIVYNRTDEALYLFKQDGSLWHNSKQECKQPGRSSSGGFLWFCTPNGFAVHPTQKSLNISQIVFNGGACMSVTVKSSGRRNITGMRGLAGNLQHGYYIANNGSRVSSIYATEEQLYYYGESWMISESDSKFNYNITGGNFTYWNGNHTVPKFLEDLAKRRDLQKLYEGFPHEDIPTFIKTCTNSWNNQTNTQCLVIIARTKNVTLGQAIIKIVEENHHKYAVLHNKPPEFKNSTPPFLNVTYGVNSSVILDLKQYVKDDFDKAENMIYSVITGLSNYILENGVFNWTVGKELRYTYTSLIFIVNDTIGSTASQPMKIYYCGCEKTSQCHYSTWNGNSTEPNLIKAECMCPQYSEGLYCEVQLDPCDAFTCYHTCNRSFNASLPSWPCSDCPEGTLSRIAPYNQTCENLDECATGHDPCEHNCTDTDGSFKCYCHKGFVLSSDGHTCDDFDECKSNSLHCGGNQKCVNTFGSATCQCAQGYSRQKETDPCTVI